MGNRYNFKKIYVLAFIIISLLLIFMVSCSSSANKTKPNPHVMVVHYIDVGQGDSILIQVNNRNLLIDSGPKTDEKKLFSYLSSIYLDKLDYVIATHPHDDHIGNMAEVIKKYDISKFYAPKIESTTKTFEKMVDALKSKNLKINIIKKGISSIDLGENTKVSVFSPTKDYYEDLNNYSPIIKVEYGNTSFLFTGDAQSDVEKDVLAANEDIKADVLKVGHHGSSTSTSINFLSKVNPSISVISVGENNIYNHPSQNTIKHLSENNTTIYRTDKDGTVVLCSDGSKITKK